jgi:hypothetical protein
LRGEDTAWQELLTTLSMVDRRLDHARVQP